MTLAALFLTLSILMTLPMAAQAATIPYRIWAAHESHSAS